MNTGSSSFSMLIPENALTGGVLYRFSLTCRHKLTKETVSASISEKESWGPVLLSEGGMGNPYEHPTTLTPNKRAYSW